MPRNGPYVLGGMVNHAGTPGDLIRELGVSKQAAGQLIDTLVLRGYLDRRANPDDRRRVLLQVTERGRAAAATIRAGVEAVDAELARRLSGSELEGLRAGLQVLADLQHGKR
jgi:DNA-binding MarR family transcriptional regulator